MPGSLGDPAATELELPPVGISRDDWLSLMPWKDRSARMVMAVITGDPYFPRRFLRIHTQQITFFLFPVSLQSSRTGTHRFVVNCRRFFFLTTRSNWVSREPKRKLFATTFHTSFFFTRLNFAQICGKPFSYLAIQLTTEPFTDKNHVHAYFILLPVFFFRSRESLKMWIHTHALPVFNAKKTRWGPLGCFSYFCHHQISH